MDPAGLFAQWPGWRIVAPSTAFDYVGLMNAALTCEDPVLVLEHVDLYTAKMQGPTHDYDYFIPLGSAKVVRAGKALTILTYSAMVEQSRVATKALGIDAEIIDLRSLDRAGTDWETIGTSIRKTNNVVVVEQGPQTVSYGAMLSDEIQRRFFDYLDQRVHGGESSPSVSKVLERAAFAMAPENRAKIAPDDDRYRPWFGADRGVGSWAQQKCQACVASNISASRCRTSNRRRGSLSRLLDANSFTNWGHYSLMIDG